MKTLYKLADRVNSRFCNLANQLDLAYSLFQQFNVNEKDYFGNTPLYYAIVNNEIDLARHIINQNAKLFAIDAMNYDALHYAVLIGSQPMVNLIMETGGWTERPYFGTSIMNLANITGVKVQEDNI